MVRRSLVPLLIVLLGLTLWSSAYPQTATPTLQQAIAAGQANTRFYGTGGSSGDSVMVEVSKGPKAASGPKTVTVPPGSQLESSQGGAQNMMVLGVGGRVTGPSTYAPSDNIVIPETGTATYILNAFCAEFHKDNPSESTQFTLRSPDATLACIARQSLKAHSSIQTTQAAVWMFTDRLTFTEMNETFSISSSEWNNAEEIVSACGITPR
jgi:TQXA domain-containing protein